MHTPSIKVLPDRQFAIFNCWQVVLGIVFPWAKWQSLLEQNQIINIQ